MLKKNTVIIFPTDTVYGIGCSVFDKEAQKRIYEIKHRPLDKRLSVLCKDLSQIEMIAELSLDAKRIISAFMPGGLTIIVPSKKELIGEGIMDTVGVRIPNHPLTLKLLDLYGPLATTSVNVSGNAPLNDYDEIVKEFGMKVDAVYQNELTLSRISSTVIDLTQEPIQLIRAGEIPFEEILRILYK